MTPRTLLIAALIGGLAFSAAADLSPEYREWAAGPVQFLMTKEESAKWKTLRTDDDARAFVALFWARRDPTPGTPRNELQEDFEARVDYANRNFGSGERQRGSLTDRGKTLILYGMPKRIARVAPPSAPEIEEQRSDTFQWTYEGSDEVTQVFGTPRATIRFVDRFGLNDYKVDRGSLDLHAAQERAIARRITQPELTEAPTFATPAAPVATAVEARPIETALKTAALQKAIDDFKTSPKSAKATYATWSELVTAGGTYYVPVLLYVPRASGIAPSDNLTFFGVVQDQNGNNVQAFETPAKLVATKDDYYVDRSLLGLPAGKHRGYFGLAENGNVLSLVASDMDLRGTIDKSAPAVSRVLLSNNIYPLTVAQRPDEPYAFGGLKVVPKGDKLFRSGDDLWYFVELRNPGVVDPAPTDAQPIVGAPIPTPRVQVRIDVEGTDVDGNKKKMTAPPREVEAVEIKGVPGHYGVGSAIPLASFKPGDYTFTMKVIDTVRKSSYIVSDTFRVIP
jgi:GWxTD domain-containing protein